MKKLIKHCLAIALFVTLSVVEGSHSKPIHASISTPSATPTVKSASQSAVTPSETQDIQEKIKTLVKENLSATESNLKDKINQHTLVGYVGKINSINSGNITLDTKEASLIQITSDDKTTFTKSGNAIKLSGLALSDKLLVIGTLIKDDIVLAKRIIVVSVDPDAMTSSTVVGKITSLDLKKKTITLSVDNQEIIYLLTKKSTIKLDELSTGQTLFAISKQFQGKDYLSRAKVI